MYFGISMSRKYCNIHIKLISIIRKLFELPESRGGIVPEDTTKTNLEKVLNKYFPVRLYHTFRQVQRRKALTYLLGERSNGKRKESVGK